MRAVSNTSPLNYLVLIRETRVLTDLFGRIHIPETVRHEMLAQEAPDAVRQFASALPAWIEVHAVEGELESPAPLHRGEVEAILLARQLRADALLMDELDGRAAARKVGLTVIGTLGVLD